MDMRKVTYDWLEGNGKSKEKEDTGVDFHQMRQ